MQQNGSTFIRATLLPVVLLCVAATLSLYLKIDPYPVPRHHGELYAAYASGLGELHEVVALRWLSPWIAHHLGVASEFSWMVFLYLSFLSTVVIFYGATLRVTKDQVYAFLVALTPAVTTAGWYGVYCPGYPDWFVLAMLSASLFVRSRLLACAFAALALWSHERSLFLLALAPVLRMLWFEERSAAWLRSEYLTLAAVVIAYFALRTHSVAVTPKCTVGFYGEELVNRLRHGHGLPTLAVIGGVLLHAYKAVLVPFAFALWTLARKREELGRISALVVLLAFFLTLVQFFVAVDYVRLVDVMVLLIVFALAKAYAELPTAERRWWRGLLLGALVVNQLLPVRYIAANVNVEIASFNVFALW
ncbi:hypothetical protein ACFL59_09675 [Planctomycetota bacterium]